MSKFKASNKLYVFLSLSFLAVAANASDLDEDCVMEGTASNLKGLNFCLKHERELRENLQTIKDVFNDLEESIMLKASEMNPQDLVEVMPYLSGIQAAQKSLITHEACLSRKDHEKYQKMFVASFVSQSVFIKNQCAPILPFINHRAFLSDERKEAFCQSLERVRNISLGSYHDLYS